MTEKSASHNSLPNKERVKLPRQRVPEQEAEFAPTTFSKLISVFPPSKRARSHCVALSVPNPVVSKNAPSR